MGRYPPRYLPTYLLSIAIITYIYRSVLSLASREQWYGQTLNLFYHRDLLSPDQ